MIQIIPAIDLIGGHCVRLTQGDYGQSKSYSSDPVALARSYEDIGLKRLHMVDLDGAKFSQPMNLDVLSAVAESCSLEIQWGGGVKSRQSLEEVLKAGAKRVICGSVAVSNPQMMESWIEEFGRERVVLGADIKNGFISINGWLQQSQVTVQELIARFNPSQVICTDISKDGMLSGPAFELYEQLQRGFPLIDITVSGGISNMDDILKLNDMGLRSVIVGKAIYEGKITLKEIEQCLQRG